MKCDSTATAIMIVDDQPDNLNVLGDILKREGFRIFAFPRGAMALSAARESPPDLILLDIRMPDMSGYDVCQRFKEDETLRFIPIIFLSAFTDPADKVKAFECGGVDYVTKPFSEIEVLARVHTHLRLRRHQVQLEELVRQRVHELAEAHNRLRIWDNAKTQWLNTLSHELRTPITGVLGVAELLLMDRPSDSDPHGLRKCFDQSCERINKLMDDASLLTQIDVGVESFKVGQVSLASIIQSALDALHAKRSFGRHVHVSFGQVPPVPVVGEWSLLVRAFTDLLLTAECCACADDTIALETSLFEDEVGVSISVGGPSLSSEELETFFEVGGQRKLFKADGDFGLGPVLASRIIRLFKGLVSVRNESERGIVIQVTLPIDPTLSAQNVRTR